MSNIAGGIREAMTQYQMMQNQKRQEKMMGLLKGIETDPETGEMRLNAIEQAKRQREEEIAKIKHQEEVDQNSPFSDQEIQFAKSQGLIIPQGMTRKQYKTFSGVSEAKVKGQMLADQTGRKSADSAFGKEYAEYDPSTVNKNMSLLSNAIERLNDPKIKTGTWKGVLNDSAQDYLSPEVSSVRDDIRGAIQGTLKQVLGGQFTEREATAMFNRAFNPRLSNEENIRRANAELSALQEMSANKDQAVKWFEKHGTLRGFKKASPGLLEKNKTKDLSTDDQQALQWANANPNDPRAKQIKQRLGVK